jgi:hypothetical protein
VICPGFVGTAMTHVLAKEKPDEVISRIPMQRRGDPSDVGHLTAFLASENASYIAGRVIYVSGGLVSEEDEPQRTGAPLPSISSCAGGQSPRARREPDGTRRYFFAVNQKMVTQRRLVTGAVYILPLAGFNRWVTADGTLAFELATLLASSGYSLDLAAGVDTALPDHRSVLRRVGPPSLIQRMRDSAALPR